jgi:hypothetical protein
MPASLKFFSLVKPVKVNFVDGGLKAAKGLTTFPASPRFLVNQNPPIENKDIFAFFETVTCRRSCIVFGHLMVGGER